MGPLAVVILAGGESQRFGSDKLVADLDGRTVLEHSLDGLPKEASVGVVGPRRPLPRAVRWLREEPPGGGPAAALVTGLAWALRTGAETICTLPGDAPAGGRAAAVLAGTLRRFDASGVVGVDPAGRDQLLLLALRRSTAQQLVDLAGSGAGHGQSVARLVAALNPPPVRVPLSAELAADIDTTDQLRYFRNLDRT